MPSGLLSFRSRMVEEVAALGYKLRSYPDSFVVFLECLPLKEFLSRAFSFRGRILNAEIVGPDKSLFERKTRDACFFSLGGNFAICEEEWERVVYKTGGGSYNLRYLRQSWEATCAANVK